MKAAGRAGEVRRVLVVKPGSMGDVVHALPVAAALARAWPEARIGWLVDRRWAPLLAGNPHLSWTVEFPREEFRGPAGLLRGAAWFVGLRRLGPDLCLDLQGLLRSGLMAFASGARETVGMGDAREGARFFYQKSSRVVPGEHSVIRYLRILEPLGINIPAQPEFPLPPGVRPPGAPDGRFVLVNPAARGVGKSLPPDALAALLDGLAGGPPVVVVGGGGGGTVSGTIDLRGRTSLDGLIWLVRNAAAVVSVDSGPSHLAAATGRPLLAIHTWADPRAVGPFSDSALVWQSGHISPWRDCRNRPGGPPDALQAAAIARAARELAGEAPCI